MKLPVNIRRTRASLYASILAACFLCLASAAGCGSCAGDDTAAPPSSEPVNGSGGPGSKPLVGRHPAMRMNPLVVPDGAAPTVAPSASTAPSAP